MIILKTFLLICVFVITTFLGMMMANRYKERVKDLKSMMSAFNIISTKIKYTYQPLPEIFDDLSKSFNGGISNIFNQSKNKMKEMPANYAWEYAIDNSSTNMNNEDLSIIKSLNKMLGKTNAEGQLSELELISKFLENQINKAEEEKLKNEKLYKNLGMTIGLALVVILF